MTMTLEPAIATAEKATLNMEPNEAATPEEILKAPPSSLVVALYDGAIAAIEAAIDAIDDGDIEGRCNHVNLAVEIIAYLYQSLDMKEGGVVAENLGRLYRFMIVHLQEVNRNNNIEAAHNTIRLLEPLYNAWSTVDEKLTRDKAMQAMNAA